MTSASLNDSLAARLAGAVEAVDDGISGFLVDRSDAREVISLGNIFRSRRLQDISGRFHRSEGGGAHQPLLFGAGIITSRQFFIPRCMGKRSTIT